MNEGSTCDFRELSPSQARRVDALCRRFEAEWSAGREPRIMDFLRAVPDPERPALLRQLLLLELELLWDRGQRPTPEEYHARFPEHAGVIDAAFADAATLYRSAAAEFAAEATAPAGPASIGRYVVLSRMQIRSGQAELYRVWHPELG